MGYNPINHLKLLGLKDDKIDSILNSSEKVGDYDNTIICLYPDDNLLFAYVVSDNEQHLEEDVAKLNALLPC